MYDHERLQQNANQKSCNMKPTPRATPTTDKRRIFLVEDHPITRRGLVELINHEPDLLVCGEAGSAATALEEIKKHKPDLALVDITLPGRSGLTLIKDIQLWAPITYVLVLSMHDESLYAERVLRAGGHGYIMKDEGGDKVLGAIRQVLRAGRLLERETFYLAARVLESFIAARNPASDAWIVLNGLPRHVGQAADVDRLLAVRMVVALDCPAAVVHARIRADSGGDRGGRIDDAPADIARKLDIFRDRTLPLVDHYSSHAIPVVRVAVRQNTLPAEIVDRMNLQEGDSKTRCL